MAAPAITSLPEHWKQVRDAALESNANERVSLSDQTSNPTSAPTTTITVDMLAGSYFAVWDSQTMIESTDEPEQEISYLHLSLDNTNAGSQATFADLQGRFRWWRKIGTFQGLYRPDDASENVWYFGDVVWKPLSDDNDDEDEEEGELKHAEEDEDDPKERSNHGFGIAAMVALEDSGRLFLKMLYNKALPSDKPEYVHIVWKKQETAGETDPLVLSDEEALRLAIYDGIRYEERDPEVEAWERVRDAAVKEGTVISKAAALPVTPESLLGSYGAVWDGYTMLEMLDDVTEEYSWLELSEPDAKPNARDQDRGVQFRNIQGRFRWWRMIGTFKGLYKKEDADENIWAFHGVTWIDSPYDDGSESDAESLNLATEPADVSDRDTEYFGLAVLPVLDNRGKPFVELLYNSTRFEEQEKKKRTQKNTQELVEGSADAGMRTIIPPPKDYVRILWKKYKGKKTGLTMMLSGPEGTRLMRNANIDMSETRRSPRDEDNGEDEEQQSSEDEDEDENMEDVKQDTGADENIKKEDSDFGTATSYPRKRQLETEVTRTEGTSLKKVKVEA